MDEKDKTNNTVDDVNVSDAQDAQGAQSDTGSSGDNTDGGDKKEKTFTQAQVSRMMTKEKRQGAAAVYRELGIDPKDSRVVAMVKALIASQKSDGQKEAEKRAESDAKEKEAEQRVIMAETKAEAMVLGIKSEFVDDMVALVMSKMTEDSDVKTLLGEYKKKYPAWFSDGSDEGNGQEGKTGKRGTGSSIKGKDAAKNGDKLGGGIGARLAAQRRAAGSKRSYWGGSR